MDWAVISEMNSFSLSTPVEFIGAEVRSDETDTDTTMLERLAAYLEQSDYTQNAFEIDDFRYDNGRCTAQAIFVPR